MVRFENLQNAMIKENVSVKKMADFLNITETKMLEKLEGKEEFLLIECFDITKKFFDSYSIDYLFGYGQCETFY